MTAVAKVVTEFFMMVLCISTAPADRKEIRIDMVSDGGQADTIVVQRAETGFTAHDEKRGKLTQFAAIVPKDGAEGVFAITVSKGASETIDLAKGLPGANLADLRTKKRLDLKASDGERITITRSNEVVYVSAEKMRSTFVVR